MASSSSLRLDSLPPEIIQRIASVSSCESVLALIKVNRVLHTACYDKGVFRAVLRNGNGYGISKPWDCDLIQNSSSTSTVARLALADSHAWAWLTSVEQRFKDNQRLQSGEQELSEQHLIEQQLSEEQDAWSELVKNQSVTAPDPIFKWAPQLVALNHPFITAKYRLEEIVDKFRSLLPVLLHDPVKINFCITATILYHCTAALEHGSSAGPDLREYLRRLLDSGPSSASTPINLICSLLVNAHMVLREMPLPSPYRIPFRNLLDTPIPFSGTVLSGVNHLPVMTSAAFLVSGEWVGYYGFSLHQVRARWDPPMKGIRFTADPDAGPFALKASGTDNVGHFTLNGIIDESGKVELRKTYIGLGFYWDWNASMTPFGIVGTWGRGTRPHGNIWLWKRDWSQYSAQSLQVAHSFEIRGANEGREIVFPIRRDEWDLNLMSEGFEEKDFVFSVASSYMFL